MMLVVLPETPQVPPAVGVPHCAWITQWGLLRRTAAVDRTLSTCASMERRDTGSGCPDEPGSKASDMRCRVQSCVCA